MKVFLAVVRFSLIHLFHVCSLPIAAVERASPLLWVARSRSTSSSCNFPRFYFVNKEFFIASCRCDDEGKFCPGKSMTLRLQSTFCVLSESHNKENVRALPDKSRKRWKWNIYQLTKITFADSSSKSTRDPTNEWVTFFSLKQQHHHHHHRRRITTHISTLPVQLLLSSLCLSSLSHI